MAIYTTTKWIFASLLVLSFGSMIFYRLPARLTTGRTTAAGHSHVNNNSLPNTGEYGYDRHAEAEAILPNDNLSALSMSSDVERRIDTLRPITLHLLPTYKSPCWYESLPKDYRRNYRTDTQMFPEQAKRSFIKILPVYQQRMRQLERPWRIRCLPLVYIIGVAKCGTTDLYGTIVKHPHVTEGATKEPFFWDNNRWYRGARLNDFLNLYDEAAETIRNTTVELPAKGLNGSTSEYHPLVTIDASVKTLFHFGGAHTLGNNNHTLPPKFIAAHLIKNLTPHANAKIIVIIRNPTERLFSSYVFFNTVTRPSNISAKEFDSLATDHVSRMRICLNKYSLSTCLYDKRSTRTRKTVNVHAGIYYGYIRDWMAVFPDMKVIRLEDYKRDRARVFHGVVDYIGIRDVEYIDDSHRLSAKGPTVNFEMWNSTRQMLNHFYAPFNAMLADLLKDKAFLFRPIN